MAGLVVPKKPGMTEPLIGNESSEQIKRNKELVAVPVEKINEAFKRGYITAAQRNGIMREKAHAVTNEMIQEQGFFGAVLTKSIKHIQEGFDNIRDAVVREVPPDKMEAFKADMLASGQAIWGQIQVLTGIFTAVGEVTGATVERWALGAGASPGLARLLNISTDVGTGFIPVGKATQSAVKGIQRAQKLGAKSVTNQAGAVGKNAGEADKAAKEAQKAAEAAEKALTEMDGVNKTAMEAIGEGLKAEGVSRRGFLQFLATVPTAASAIKGMVKGGAKVTAAKAAKIPPPPPTMSHIFTYANGDEAVYKMSNGTLVHISDIGREGSTYTVLSGKNKGHQFGSDDFVGFTDDGDMFFKLQDSLKSEPKEIRDLAEYWMSKEEAFTDIPSVVMTPRQDLALEALTNEMSISDTVISRVANAEDTIARYKGYETHPKMRASENWGEKVREAQRDLDKVYSDYGHMVENLPEKLADFRAREAVRQVEITESGAANYQKWLERHPEHVNAESRHTVAEYEKNLVKAKAKAEELAGPDWRDKSKNKFADDAEDGLSREKGEAGDAESAFKETPEQKAELEGKQPSSEIEEPGQLVMVDGRWHVRGNNPDELLPALYGESNSREKFLTDLTKFRREMGSLTETQTHEMTAAMAERLGLGLDDLRNVVPGQALDEKQMLAYLKALEPQVAELIRLAKNAVGGQRVGPMVYHGTATTFDQPHFGGGRTYFVSERSHLADIYADYKRHDVASKGGTPAEQIRVNRLNPDAKIAKGSKEAEKGGFDAIMYEDEANGKYYQILTDKALTPAYAAAPGSEAAHNAFASHMSEFFSLAPIFRGAEVTAGRSVDILRETPPMKKLTEMLTGWDPESIAKGDFRSAMRTMAEDVLVATDRPDAVDKLVATGVITNSLWGRFKGEMWPQIREFYINLMLARPVTHVRNTVGNSYAAGNAVAERTVGGMFSLDKEKGIVMSEGFYLLKGMGAGIQDGFSAFGKEFTLGRSAEAAGKLDYIPHQIPGIAGRIINTPGDILRGTDEFYRTVLKRGSYYADAMRDATHKGYSNSPKVIESEAYRAKFGNESLSEYVQRKVNYPTQEMRVNGDAFATHNTFQDELGALASKIRAVGQVGPLVLWFPFMKTPINMAKYAWDRTPGLQLISSQLYKDIAAGGVQADMAIGRLTISSLQAMMIYNLAQEGFITGSGPVDPGLRRAWMATHQPYSVKTNKGWMPIANFEPGTTPIGLVADFAQILNQLDEPSAEQMAMAATFSVMKGMADKTYWRTLSDLTDAAGSIKEGSSPRAQIRDVILGPFMAMATGGPLGGSFTRAIDPIQRETRSFVDSFMSRIPGYSADVPPVRDIYGEPVLPPQAVGGPWLNFVQPLYEKEIVKERVRDEGDRLQIKVPPFPHGVGGSSRDDFDVRAPFPEDMPPIPLTSKQRDRWQEIFKEQLRDPETGIEKMWLDSESYNWEDKDLGIPATRARKREMFMDAMSLYRSRSRDQLLMEDRELGAKLLEAQMKKQLPMFGPKTQDDMKKEIQEGMTIFHRMPQEQFENLMRWGTPQGEEN